MPEHVHLLVKPAQDSYDISRFLLSVKGSVAAKALAYRRASSLPDSSWDQHLDIQPSGKAYFRFWQRGGGYDRNIDDLDEVSEKLEYMHTNPVKRGLCVEAADWRWSSAGHYLGLGESPIPIEIPGFR